jgi:hypothetical protein
LLILILFIRDSKVLKDVSYWGYETTDFPVPNFQFLGSQASTSVSLVCNLPLSFNFGDREVVDKVTAQIVCFSDNCDSSIMSDINGANVVLVIGSSHARLSCHHIDKVLDGEVSLDAKRSNLTHHTSLRMESLLKFGNITVRSINI